MSINNFKKIYVLNKSPKLTKIDLSPSHQRRKKQINDSSGDTCNGKEYIQFFYKKLLKSRIADIANVGGRAAGACTAAKFLQHFIREGTPWIHIDIAGVAFSKSSSKLSSPGATGWGVASLNRFIADNFEAKQK